MLEPLFRNAVFSHGIAQASGWGTRSIRVHNDEMMEEPSRMNLADDFFRRIVGKLPQILADERVISLIDFLLSFLSPSGGDFAHGRLIQILKIETSSPCRFEGED